MAENETPVPPQTPQPQEQPKINTDFAATAQEATAKPETNEIDPNDPAQNPRQGLPTTVEVQENAPGPIPLTQPDPNAKGPWIEYRGVALLRIMDENAWRAAGVDSTKYCQWNALNKMRLPRSLFNDQELQYLLRVDGRFALVDN